METSPTLTGLPDPRAERRQLRARLEAATAAARAAVGASAELLVAAGRSSGSTRELVAHSVFDIGSLTGTHGLTACGLHAGDEVVLVPEVRWCDISDSRRCPDCLGDPPQVAATGGAVTGVRAP